MILAGGLRLIFGTGQLSFAHASFWAMGAYTSALLVMRAGFSFWLALPISGLVGAIAAVLIGFPCLRLKGPYFFIVTLAFGEIVRLFLVHSVDLFGGDSGISAIPYPDPIKLPGLVIEFSSRSVHYYYLMLSGLLSSMFIFYKLEKSRFGMSCYAILENDRLSESLGIDQIRYKMVAFVLASTLAAMAGSFLAHYVTYISPGFFTFNESNMLLIMVMIGGSRSIIGTIIGVILITVLSEFTREVREYEIIMYGAALVLVFRFVPGGILDLYSKLIDRVKLSKLWIKAERGLR
jgi:branched-chain amino acid transport system permease protein